jgi:nucleoid-associated protein YgaU
MHAPIGALRSYTAQAYNTTYNSSTPTYLSTYTNAFLNADSYLDAGQTVTSTGTGAPGTATTTRGYNANRELVSFTDSGDNTRNRYFANNASGQALTVVQGNFATPAAQQQAFKDALARKDNTVKAQHYFFASGQAVGSFGQLRDSNNQFKADFDVNYTPVSADYPAATPSEVIAQSGDTLRTIAARVFGDPALWYVLAEENV